MPLALPALVTLLAVLWYVVTGIQVGRMRDEIQGPRARHHRRSGASSARSACR